MQDQQLNMPKVTLPQIIGLVVAGIPLIAQLLQAWNVYTVTLAQQAALSDVVQWGGAIAAALFIGDAGVRIGRSVGVGKVLAAKEPTVPVQTKPPEQ